MLQADAPRPSEAEQAPSPDVESPPPSVRPSRREAEAAVRTLIRWAGDDPAREGLRDTPARVARAYEEWFSGYAMDPVALLQRTFGEVAGYADAVVLRDISFHSTCEHHMAPIHGRAHIAYLPRDRVVGISKLARLVEACGRRLQIQERMTAEVADALQQALEPRGVIVVIEAAHECMSSRGVLKHGALLVTRAFRGAFDTSPGRKEALDLIRTAG